MMGGRKILPVCIALIVLSFDFGRAFSQGSGENLSTDAVVGAVKQAIKETDREKAEDHARHVAGLRAKLDSATREWIKTAVSAAKRRLNKLRHENWDLGGKIDYPVPYDHYLRDFSYVVKGSDLKENSLLSEYEGRVDVLEKLYIEAPHSKDAVDISKYFYTLSRSITLSLDYKRDKFVVSEVSYEPYQVESGWRKNS